MKIHSNFEYLCRVCAINTKGKNSVAECVYILKTAGLKEKLDKFLYLKISEDDSFPKVLCKSCFRQVEATASLSNIAKHTLQVFRDFLLSNLPKGPSESTNTSEFTSSDFMGNKDYNEKSRNDVSAQLPASTSTGPGLLSPPPPPPLLQPLTTTSRKDEVVVNVSVTDPLTRDNQQKMISNSQRRQSLLIESRYTPKSIAQKPRATTAAPRLIAPKPTLQIETISTANNLKIPVTSLNFYPAKTQQSPQSAQVTTFSSGGYVIGRIDTNKEQTKKIIPLLTADNILQQKRKNLVKALNNIKANNSGQVSLLKSSQRKQAEAMQNILKTPLTEVVNQAAEDELPEKIIIAAPKNKSVIEKSKKEPLNLSSKVLRSATPLPATAISALVQQQHEESNAFNATLPKPAFPDDIQLGRVIRDMDLLKLILKALKWPVNKVNMEFQLLRLKNSKFTDIISDANLLQDTDLTQLLSPYLAPVLLAAQALQQQQQQQQQQQGLENISLNQNVTATATAQPKMTALEVAQAEINKSMPYKLPPETSVQLVPVTPEETEAMQSPPLAQMCTTTSTSGALKRDRQKETKKTTVSQKRQRRTAAHKARDSIVISDEDDASAEEEAPKKSRKRSAKSNPNIHIELNPNFLAQFNMLNGSGGSESDELMALLMKQKTAVMKDKKIQRRRRNSASNLITLPPSEFDALIDLDDDFVLMEPVTTTSSLETVSTNQELQQQKPDLINTFAIPSVPLITRPIIKRRKTVIHPPKNRFDLSIELKNKDQTPIASGSASIAQIKEKHIEEAINQVATGNITNVESIKEQTPLKNAPNEGVVVMPGELPITKTPQHKKLQNKSTLGQQLMEAIGLEKIPLEKMIKNTQGEAASSPTLLNSITVLPNSKQSIQQIRTALKKSLKQAQEQQQQRKKELSSSNSNTVIQDADSTTKPAIKEIVVVEGKGNKSDTCSSMVDVEEQIDKVTLMVRQNEEENTGQSTVNTTTAEKDGKKEVQKLPSIKIQERRRTMLASGMRAVGGHSIGDKEMPYEEQQQEKIIRHDEIKDDNENLQKDDSANISSSSGAASNVMIEVTATTANVEIIIPKRRGRKRLVDKQNELEAAEANEREKNKTINIEEDSETTSHIKTEEDTESNKTSGRPTRQSKTQSKYYKGPDKPTLSRRFLPSRTTRNRKYC